MLTKGTQGEKTSCYTSTMYYGNIVTKASSATIKHFMVSVTQFYFPKENSYLGTFDKTSYFTSTNFYQLWPSKMSLLTKNFSFMEMVKKK